MRIKKHHFLYFTSLMAFIFSLSFGSTIFFVSNTTSPPFQPPNTAVSGISNYEILQSVKYNVKMNYTASTSYPNTYYYKIPRLNNRTPNSSLTRYCAPYQESDLLYNNQFKIDGGISNKKIGLLDRFNNTYDAVNITLGMMGSYDLKLNQEYNVTLNQVSFSGISDSDVGTYNFSDMMFNLYCNNSNYYNLNTSDPELRNLVIGSDNSIGIKTSDNPVEKARKIINWVSSNIDYEQQDQEKGASWAYDNLKGDCSEYADLMITLLRILEIPSRKVTGLLVSNNPNFRPSVGEKLSYTFGSATEDTVMGHAWMEYYVPNIGWIACDPTWNRYYDYFNQIDFLRFGFNVGSWMKDAEGDYVSEFPFPMGYSNTNYNFEFRLTVLETDLLPAQQNIWEIFTIPIIIFSIIGIVGLISSIIYKRFQM